MSSTEEFRPALAHLFHRSKPTQTPFAHYLAAGIGISLMLGQLLRSLLYLVPYEHNGLIYQVSVQHPLIFGIASTALIALSLAAACLPACRAARVDPMVALRYE